MGTFTTALVDYNGAQVVMNNGVVTVPYGQTVAGTVYTAIYSVNAGSTVAIGSLFTVTLPSGCTFGSAPAAMLSTNGAQFALTAGGAGSNSATYTLAGRILIGGATISLGSFVMEGASTTLGVEYNSTVFPLSVQVSGSSNASGNDLAPVSSPAFTSTGGAFPETPEEGGGQIDWTAPSYGHQFIAGGNDGKTVAGAGSLGTFGAIVETSDPFKGNVPVLGPFGQLNNLAAGDKVTLKFLGDFEGIVEAYATPLIDVCQTSLPFGATAGTVYDDVIYFGGVPIATPVHVCIIAGGRMQPNDNDPPYGEQGYQFVFFPAAGVNDFYAGFYQIGQYDFFSDSPEAIFGNGFEP